MCFFDALLHIAEVYRENMKKKFEKEAWGGMIRGCEKRIYYLKNPESELFDEAYLVLRRGVTGVCATPRELEREAMRIVRGGDDGRRVQPRASGGRIRAFILGAALSALLIGIFLLIFCAVA